MSCCGGKRASWNSSTPGSARPTPDRPMGVPASRGGTGLVYIGAGSIAVRGAVTGTTYVFHRMIGQDVDRRDAETLLQTGRFAKSRPWE